MDEFLTPINELLEDFSSVKEAKAGSHSHEYNIMVGSSSDDDSCINSVHSLSTQEDQSCRLLVISKTVSSIAWF